MKYTPKEPHNSLSHPISTSRSRSIVPKMLKITPSKVPRNHEHLFLPTSPSFEVTECGDAHDIADKDTRSRRLNSARCTTLQKYIRFAMPVVRWVAEIRPQDRSHRSSPLRRLGVLAVEPPHFSVLSCSSAPTVTRFIFFYFLHNACTVQHTAYAWAPFHSDRGLLVSLLNRPSFSLAHPITSWKRC